MNPVVRAWTWVCIGLVATLAGGRAAACPFCSAVSLTFAQEIAQSQAAVLAELVEPPPAASLGPRAEGPLPKGRFRVVDVLKGGDLVAAAGLTGAGAGTVETIMLEQKPVGATFLLMGVEPPDLVWSSPVEVSPRAVAYVKQLGGLPEKGPDRLAFFQDYLEDEDDSLARDAYDEFAVAPYADVRGLRDRMSPDRLLGWIENPQVQANRRRLYATMLGVCGRPADAERIAAILEGTDLPPEKAEIRNGLDALIACYVTLRGPEGLDLVDRLFLQRQAGREVPFSETYGAVMALRFLGEESDVVPRDRVLRSLRILLDEPKLADLVIADLARWQDWSAIDKLVSLFKNATADNVFVREPVVNYLKACPLPAAAAAVAELETIDPEAVRRAATLAGLAGVVAAAPSTTAADPGEDAVPATDVVAPTAADVELAKRIGPVLADEEATDDEPGRHPEPVAATPAGRPPWMWAAWAAVVILVAVVARAMLRPAVDPAGR
jgi:hypothetical protein